MAMLVDTSLWLVLGSMAGTAGVLGLFLDGGRDHGLVQFSDTDEAG